MYVYHAVIDLSSIEPESLGPLHLEEIPLCSFTEKGRPYKPKSKKNKKKWRKDEEHRSKRKADMVDQETRRSSGKDQGGEVRPLVFILAVLGFALEPLVMLYLRMSLIDVQKAPCWQQAASAMFEPKVLTQILKRECGSLLLKQGKFSALLYWALCIGIPLILAPMFILALFGKCTHFRGIIREGFHC